MHARPLVAFCLALLCAFFLRGETALAQGNRGSVTGTVTDTVSQLPLQGAVVQAIGTNPDLTPTVFTDALGRFHFDTLAVGVYHLRIRKIGFHVVETDPMQIVAGGTRTVSVLMERQATMLDSFVVQGKRIADVVEDPTRQILVGVLMDDETNTPLPRGNVALHDIHDKVVASQITDTAGRFHFVTPAPGTYTMSGERAGFQTAVQKDFRLKLGDTLVVEFRLKRNAVLLAPMTVTASAQSLVRIRDAHSWNSEELYDRMRRYRGRPNVRYVTRDTIDAYAVRKQTVGTLLHRLDLDRSTGTCLGTGVYVNGVPSYPSVDLDISRLDMIEIYTHPVLPDELASPVQRGNYAISVATAERSYQQSNRGFGMNDYDDRHTLGAVPSTPGANGSASGMVSVPPCQVIVYWIRL